MKPSKNRFRLKCQASNLRPFLGSGLVLIANLHGQNAPVIFGAAQPISGNTDVWNYGTTTWAKFSGLAASPSQTVNGVLFSTGSATSLNGNEKSVSWDGGTTFKSIMAQGNVDTPSLPSGSAATPFAGLTAEYRGILELSSVGATVGTANIAGLTSGRVYAIQAWANNSVGGSGNHITIWSSTVQGSSGNSALIGQFVTPTGSSTAVEGRLGSYMISGFTANSSNQLFDVNCNNALRFTAIQVRDVTGYWSGQAGTGAWDSTSRNFTGGNDSLGVGGMTFANVGTLGVNSVVFADMDGFARGITQNNVTVQAGGVSTGTVTFENDAINYTFTNASGTTGINGTTQLVHDGTGRVTLNSANTYSGGTIVNSGTLVVNNTTGSGTGTGTLTIGKDARLEGNGIIAGMTTISGTHAPGNSPGTQTFEGGIAYSGANSLFLWDLTSNISDSTSGVRGSDWDAVDTTGTMSVDPAAVFRLVLAPAVNFTAPFWDSTQTWNVFNATTINSVFKNFEVTGGTGYDPSLGSFSMTTSGTLVWSAIPEPSTALAGLLLAAGLLRRRRKSVG